ncbi:MAG: glycosyltransferase [Candidatus Latescibacteria bacterium]|nr:glycosyltransferase [Candidatus Latescibacterota bacterium]NIM66520.1 glycosyltransferase [Candidatus Latescibacterota bacterium]NIO03000.1 glycosyltransferase [Candidatus Latescibacterota bacterium]NIO30135.1 glycosyltransferase [Candidatus Latescibacterota bacterium]NIO57754.1 glycosyltransferase [Candidatus Latescibacterota bacterium]
MWAILFWCSVAVIFYPYLGYPSLLFLFGKLRREKASESKSNYLPTVCLFISAFNEEKIIRRKIENSLALSYPREKLRILIASDGSTDATVQIPKNYSDMGVELFHQPQRRGKSAVINDVMENLTEEIVVFTDANCLFEEDALEKLIQHFSDPRIGCVVGKLNYVERHRSSVGKGEGVYWKYESRISILESALKSVLVATGPIFAIRRNLFSRLYPDVANDFQLPVEIASRGYGVVYEPEAVAIERSTIFWREEFKRKVRIILRGLTGFAILKSKFRGFRLWQFLSHKLIRWTVAPFLFLILISNIMLVGSSWFYTVVLAFQSIFYLAAMNGWRLKRTSKPRSIFYVPFYFTMVNFAAIVAIAQFLAGKRLRVWEKAESARFAPAPAKGKNAAAASNREDAGLAPHSETAAPQTSSSTAQLKK